MQNQHHLSIDALAEELGAVAGQIERETNLRLTAAIADLQREAAEREMRFLKLELRYEEKIASLKDGPAGRDGADGKDADVEAIVSRVLAQVRMPEDGKEGPAGPPGENGRDADLEALDATITERVAAAVSALPPPKDGERGQAGRDADEDSIVQRVLEKIPAPVNGKDGADGREGPPGKLPAVKEWTDRVYYDGDVVAHSGGLYQALRDTAKDPKHADWICLASPGRDGADGRSFAIRGTFKEDEEYHELDVVSLNGASFTAKRDNPGACPGDGWQLTSMQGRSGKPGERGAPGPKADRGPKVKALSVDGDGLLSLEHEDGTIVTCDLYPLLSKIA